MGKPGTIYYVSLIDRKRGPEELDYKFFGEKKKGKFIVHRDERGLIKRLQVIVSPAVILDVVLT